MGALAVAILLLGAGAALRAEEAPPPATAAAEDGLADPESDAAAEAAGEAVPGDAVPETAPGVPAPDAEALQNGPLTPPPQDAPAAIAPPDEPAVAGPDEPVAPALTDEPVADFSSDIAAIDVTAALAETRVSDPAEPGAAWFTIYVENSGENLQSRVLLSIDPPSAGLSLIAPGRRPTLIEVAGSDSAVIIERADAFGDNAFRIILPPSYETALALHFVGVGPAPTLFAWTESALIAHNRQISLLVGAVGGLLVAAFVFAAGAAVLLGRPFAQWAALFLGAVLFAFLSSVRLFDDTFLAAIGGPYGLFALALALAVASGSRLIDHVASYEAFWPPARRLADWLAIGIAILGVAAALGLPGAGLLVRILAVVGAAAAAGYLAHCGRLGVAGARRLAPAATIFALVTAVATFRALGFLGTGVLASSVIAGFSAVGAVLVALTGAVASAEPTVARLRAMRRAHLRDDMQATSTDEVIAQSREHAAVVASHQGIFDLDLDSNLLSLSPEAAHILGLGDRHIEIAHEEWLRHLFPEDRDVYIEAIETYRRQPDLAYRLEFRVKRPDGDVAWFELRATMIGQATEPDRCLGLIANVTARKEAEAPFMSPLFDRLTGLGNRLALFTALEEAENQLPELALAIADIDRFKTIDTALGPEKTDLLLQQIAARLEKEFRASGKVFRIGGDMFAIVTPKPPSLESLGDAVLKTMVRPFKLDDREIFLQLSVGLAPGEGARDAQDLVSKAEIAMVQAKRDGGDCARLYADAAALPVKGGQGDSVALDTGLRRALERGEIAIHYQPVMRVADGSVAGFEALLRWNHPEHGVIEPDDFIPYAERAGLILPIGRLALVRAAEDLARWQHFFPLVPPLFVSVNVSWRQIESKTFTNEVKAVLAQNELAKNTLRLEVTETAIARAEKSAEIALKRIRTLGAGLAIDDFGTGHSSLEQLRRFSFDAVKIDKSFLVAGEKEEAIFASMVQLAHDLRLDVVAEGVETEEEVHRLRELRCEYAQGFFFSPPLPAAEIPNFIAMTYTQ